jgi:hypothetical protein
MAVEKKRAAELPQRPARALNESRKLHCDPNCGSWAKPIFVGHYWLTGTPALLSDKVACVDYSVAKGGKLVAYRWDSEPFLENSKLDWVKL